MTGYDPSGSQGVPTHIESPYHTEDVRISVRGLAAYGVDSAILGSVASAYLLASSAVRGTSPSGSYMRLMGSGHFAIGAHLGDTATDWRHHDRILHLP